MSRPTIKIDLLSVARDNYEKLNLLISSLTEKELNTLFDFSKDEKKKENHWKRDKNVRDVLIHLYEWHNLMLDWVDANLNGKEKSFLPSPYTWKTYGEMNIEFWKKHQKTLLEDAKNFLNNSHKRIIELIDTFSNEELFSKGMYKWTGGTTLGSYFVSVSSSHYDWAIKKIKAHQKNCNR